MTRPLRSIDVPGLAHNAPIPTGARVGNVICTSAISGKDAATGELPPGADAQAAHAFRNLASVLSAGGGSVAEFMTEEAVYQFNGRRRRLRDSARARAAAGAAG